MKKIISFMLMTVLACTIVGCGTDSSSRGDSSAEKNPSGINSNVTAEKSGSSTKYNFEGFLTTEVPEGIFAEDKSINSGATLFAFYDEEKTYLDVTFYFEKEATDAEMAQKARELAKNGNSSKADDVTIGDITFYGVNTPDYGIIRYVGAVDGIEVDLAVYVDAKDPVVKAFMENTAFVTE